jgi:hypothetical protein
MTLWTWIQEFQTLTVGIIGFAGVISTLLINARQAREQRREERRHERQTLRVALIEELKINREMLAYNIDKVKDGVNELSERGDISCRPILWMMSTGRSQIELAFYHKRRCARSWVPTSRCELSTRSYSLSGSRPTRATGMSRSRLKTVHCCLGC